MTDREQPNPNSECAAWPRENVRHELACSLLQWRVVCKSLRDPDFQPSRDVLENLAEVSGSLSRLVAGLQAVPAGAGDALGEARPVVSPVRLGKQPATRIIESMAGGSMGDRLPAFQAMAASGSSADFDPRAIEQAPSLAAILERLRRPTDTDAGVLPVPQPKSLSDEDLLGLEMMQLVGAAAGESREPLLNSASAAVESGSMDSLIAAGAATIHDDSSGVFDTVCIPDEPPVATADASQLPVETEQRRGRIESAWSAAFAKTDFAASGAPASQPLAGQFLPTAVPQAGETGPGPDQDGVALSFGHDGLSLTGFDEGQDAFVRSTIEHSNLAKLEQLRQQLQEIFQAAGQAGAGQAGNSGPAPAASPSGSVPASFGPITEGSRPAPKPNPDAVPDVAAPTEECLRQLIVERTGGHREPARTELLAQPPPEPLPEIDAMTNHLIPASDSPNALPTEPSSDELIMNTTEQSRTSPVRENHFVGLASAAYLTNLDLEETEAASRPAPLQPNPGAQPQREAGAGSEAGESDVADYMQQLLGRLRGGSQQPTAPSAPARSAAPAGGAPCQPGPVSVPAQQQSEPAEEIQPLTPQEYVPRAVAPEKNMNIDALRQLANQSTRSAVKVFAKSQKKALHFAQLAAIGGGITGAGLFAFIAQRLGTPFYILSLLCLGGAAFAGYRFARENVGLSLARRQKSKQP